MARGVFALGCKVSMVVQAFALYVHWKMIKPYSGGGQDNKEQIGGNNHAVCNSNHPKEPNLLRVPH